MRDLELSRENIRDLRTIDNFKEISRTIYGLILETQIALREAKSEDEIGEIMLQQEEATFQVFLKAGICLSDRIVHKISSIIINLCVRATGSGRENKKRSRIRGRVLTLEPPPEI